MSATNNHFITVSRAGELMARRKGGAPVCVATVATGLDVETDELARARGVPARLLVRFAAGGKNRELKVMAIELEEGVLEVDGFLTRYAVGDKELGRWIRARIELALDAAR